MGEHRDEMDAARIGTAGPQAVEAERLTTGPCLATTERRVEADHGAVAGQHPSWCGLFVEGETGLQHSAAGEVANGNFKGRAVVRTIQRCGRDRSDEARLVAHLPSRLPTLELPEGDHRNKDADANTQRPAEFTVPIHSASFAHGLHHAAATHIGQ